MDDAGIVAAMREQDPAGLAAAYDAYADALFTYCVSQLRDRDAAADAVHDAFVVAYQRVGQLRDPSRLRPWLYAIARNECRRTFRDRRRSAELDEAATVSDETAEVGAGLREEELRGLIRTAAGGLNPREREVLELAVRHDLEVADVAAALGQSPKHVHALLSKARQQLERSLAALIVARTGRQACETLDGLLAGWDGSMTVLLRKRVARHVDSCPTCMERKREDVSATALLAGVPLLAAPVVLRERVLDDAVAPASAGVDLAEWAGRFDEDGFPGPLDGTRRVAGWLLPAAAALVGAALVLGGLSFVVGGPGDAVPATDGDQLAAPTAPTASAATAPPATEQDTAPRASGSPSVPAGAPEIRTPHTAEPPSAPAAEPTTPVPTFTREQATFTPAAPPPLSVFCDTALMQRCERVELSDGSETVYLVANGSGPLHVRARAGNPEWLVVTPSSLDVAPEQPARATIEVLQPCADTEAVVTFAVAEPVHTVSLTVTGAPCIQAR